MLLAPGGLSPQVREEASARLKAIGPVIVAKVTAARAHLTKVETEALAAANVLQTAQEHYDSEIRWLHEKEIVIINLTVE